MARVDGNRKARARTRRAARGSGRVLSRDAIAEVAFGVMLVEPATSLTLARLGTELGADPTAVYRYYRSRDELMLDIADRCFAVPTAAFHQGERGWRQALVDFALAVRGEFLRRPALTAEVGCRFTGGANERRAIETIRAILGGAGFPPEVVVTQTRAFGSMIAGHTVMTATLLALPKDARDAEVAIAQRIHRDDVVSDAFEFENESFRVILETYLNGLAALLPEPQVDHA